MSTVFSRPLRGKIIPPRPPPSTAVTVGRLHPLRVFHNALCVPADGVRSLLSGLSCFLQWQEARQPSNVTLMLAMIPGESKEPPQIRLVHTPSNTLC